MTPQKLTLVLGASPNPSRYSHRAVQLLRSKNHPVIPVGNRSGSIADLDIITIEELPESNPQIDTITLYLSAGRQKAYYDTILRLAPKRLIFNPGTENPELVQLAKTAGIKTEIACTLVLLNIGSY